MYPTEIQVPVPWGFVAGKSWGDKNKKIIIAFHGFQDNANSFDKIIPHLSTSYQYLCFDLPSHGKSSHLISKSLISIYDFVLTIKLLLDYLKQDKYIIMGHSFGGVASLLFTQMYPERVEKIIVFDVVHYMPTEPEQLIDKMKNNFESYSQRNNRYDNSAPVYSREEAMEKINDGRDLSENMAAIFFDRSVQLVEDNKYRFTLAQHLKYLLSPTMSIQYITDLIKASPIKCPHLLIRASQSDFLYVYMRDVLEVLKSTNKSFESYEVEGPHDIHIANPKTVANYVNAFLLKNKM